MEQQPGAVLINELISTQNLEILNERCNKLKVAFTRYRSMEPSDPLKQVLHNVLITYGNTCIKLGGQKQRRFEAFICKYIHSERVSNKRIAANVFEAPRTFYKDIEHVLDDLMVLVYGIDALIWN